MQRAERRNVRRMVNNGEIKGGKSRKELRRKRGGKKCRFTEIHNTTGETRREERKGWLPASVPVMMVSFFSLSLLLSFFSFSFFQGARKDISPSYFFPSIQSPLQFGTWYGVFQIKPPEEIGILCFAVIRGSSRAAMLEDPSHIYYPFAPPLPRASESNQIIIIRHPGPGIRPRVIGRCSKRAAEGDPSPGSDTHPPSVCQSSFSTPRTRKATRTLSTCRFMAS